MKRTSHISTTYNDVDKKLRYFEENRRPWFVNEWHSTLFLVSDLNPFEVNLFISEFIIFKLISSFNLILIIIELFRKQDYKIRTIDRAEKYRFAWLDYVFSQSSPHENDKIIKSINHNSFQSIHHLYLLYKWYIYNTIYLFILILFSDNIINTNIW